MSAVEVIHARDRAAWHAARARDVTASQVGALFDVHPYTTRFQLWHEKAGNLPPAEETEAMLRGTLLEPVAVELIRRQHPEWTVEYSTAEMIYYRDPAARLGATPDVRAFDPDRGWGNVQIKTMSEANFRAYWLDEDGEPDPPLWISLQTELERDLMDRAGTPATWAAAAAMTFSSFGALDLRIVPVPSVPGLVSTMARKSLAFWNSIDTGDAPAPDFDVDGPTIAAAYAGDEDEALDLTTDADVEALIEERHRLAAVQRDAKVLIDRIDAQLRHRLGKATAAYLGEGRVITWRHERRPGRFVAPSDGRRLRLPQPRKESAHA